MPLWLLLSLAVAGVVLITTAAVIYKPGNVPNKAVYGYQSFDVQSYLTKKGSLLANMYLDSNGVPLSVLGSLRGKRPADIIQDIARNRNVKPQFLLMLLDAEQGLISDHNPHDLQYRLDWATGYGAYDPLGQKSGQTSFDTRFKGFQKQLNGAASTINAGGASYNIATNAMKGTGLKIYTGQRDPQTGLGKQATVKPKTFADALLLAYTPHGDSASARARILKRIDPALFA